MQSAKIEKDQKSALKIILESNYSNYETACTLLNLEPPEFWRTELCLNFARRDFKRELKSKIRAGPRPVKEYNCRTHRLHRYITAASLAYPDC